MQWIQQIPKTIVYYVVKCVSDSYTYQEETACDGKISNSGELVVKSAYLRCMKYSTKWCWGQEQPQQIVVFLTCRILNLCLDVVVVKEVQDIPIIVCNKKQSRQDLQIITMFITD